MKRLVGHMGGAQAQSHAPAEPASKPAQDNALGLMHLRKLFAEFRHPSPTSTQKDQEDKLYNMLPLFCKVRPEFFYLRNRFLLAVICCLIYH